MTEAFYSLIKELKSISDGSHRADLLVELSDDFEAVPESVAKRPFSARQRVPQCESEVYTWVLPQDQDPNPLVKLYFAVENPQGISAKALATLLATLSGSRARAVAGLDESVVYDVFGKNLSMGKGLGLIGMVQLVRQQAGVLLNTERSQSTS